MNRLTTLVTAALFAALTACPGDGGGPDSAPQVPPSKPLTFDHPITQTGDSGDVGLTAEVPLVSAATCQSLLQNKQPLPDQCVALFASFIDNLPPPPGAESCVYTYSKWDVCQKDDTQTRVVLSSLPANCTGKPVLIQHCTYYVDPTLPIAPTVCISGGTTYSVGGTVNCDCSDGTKGSQACQNDGSFSTCVCKPVENAPDKPVEPPTPATPTFCAAGTWNECNSTLGEKGKQLCKSDGSGYGICQICPASAWAGCKTVDDEAGQKQCKSDGSAYGVCETFCKDPIGSVICDVLNAMKEHVDKYSFGEFTGDEIVTSLKIEIMEAPQNVASKIDFAKLKYTNEKGEAKAIKTTHAYIFDNSIGSALDWNFNLKDIGLTLYDVRNARIVLVPKVPSGSTIISFPISGIRATATLDQKGPDGQYVKTVTFLDPCWSTEIRKKTDNPGTGPKGEEEGGWGNIINLNKDRISFCAKVSVDRKLAVNKYGFIIGPDIYYNNIQCTYAPCLLDIGPKAANTPEWFYRYLVDTPLVSQEISKPDIEVKYSHGSLTVKSLQNWVYKPGSSAFINDKECFKWSKDNIKFDSKNTIYPLDGPFQNNHEFMTKENCSDLINRWVK